VVLSAVAGLAMITAHLTAQCTGTDVDPYACGPATSGSLSPGLSPSSSPEQATGPNQASGGLKLNAAPAPPTEFQRFVAASTGSMLPVYGANFFLTIPASFRPLESGPAPGQTILGPGDELRVRVWGQVNLSTNLRVSREGDIYLPKIGAVRVAGLPFSGVRDHLRDAISQVYRNFDLSVDLGEIHTIQIYVTGFARRPGEYTVSALSTLVNAIFECGGPDSAGSLRHVELKRAGKVIGDFDLYALLILGDKTGDMQLLPGDVLYIPPVGPEVALLGSVGNPAIYELRGNESLGKLLEAAGGPTAVAAGDRISIDRIIAHERRQAFAVAADSAGLAAVLRDGDIVRVDPIVSTYEKTVTLRGAVANPGHFRWHQGMRLSELLPDRDALLKRGYWWRRTQLGLPVPDLMDPAAPGAANGAAIAVGTALQESADSPLPTQVPAQSANDETNWNEATIERLDRATMTTSLIPFALGKLVLDHDGSQDLELQPGDVITIFSQSDIKLPIREQTKYVTLEGEFVHPGVYSLLPGEMLSALVKRVGGLTPQAYVYAAVFTRRSTQQLEQQRLNQFADQLEGEILRSTPATGPGVDPTAFSQEQAANREIIARLRSVRADGRVVLNLRQRADGSYELPDMELEDGDRFIVPFEPETVQVLGAVYDPHAFLYRPHATEEKYLRLAGGPNRNADRRRIYVLRADGSVEEGGKGYGTLFSHGAKKIALWPGDSIIVPEKPVRGSSLNQALAWSQTVSQSALTALSAVAISRY
jgi:polysaccharide export outer membrane protein